MRGYVIIILMVLLHTSAGAQSSKKTPAKPVVVPPEFMYGCVEEYLAKNIRYPEAASANGIEGRVRVKFIIDEKGKPASVHIAGAKRLGGGLEQEAIRVVSTMPAWRPALYKKKPVKYMYTLPVVFYME